MLIFRRLCCCINKELWPSGAASCLKSKYDRCGSRREFDDALQQFSHQLAKNIALDAVEGKMFGDAVEQE
jgi:L-rhamnose isomerase